MTASCPVPALAHGVEGALATASALLAAGRRDEALRALRVRERVRLASWGGSDGIVGPGGPLSPLEVAALGARELAAVDPLRLVALFPRDPARVFEVGITWVLRRFDVLQAVPRVPLEGCVVLPHTNRLVLLARGERTGPGAPWLTVELALDARFGPGGSDAELTEVPWQLWRVTPRRGGGSTEGRPQPPGWGGAPPWPPSPPSACASSGMAPPPTIPTTIS